MIVYKQWVASRYRGTSRATSWKRHGWFLLGFIPLYVADLEPRGSLWPRGYH